VSAPIITALYVPGDRPERFDKAFTSGTQMVIVDLEDAVAPVRKTLALDAVAEWLHAQVWTSGPVIQVRVNVDHRAEVERLAEIEGPFELRLPKVDSVADLDVVASASRRFAGITALIESAVGVEQAASIAHHPVVTGLALGEADLASDLGSGSDAVLDHARLRVLFAARAAGLPAPMMSPYPHVADLDGLRADTARGRTLGLVGRTAIHPRQLGVIADVFRPSPADLDWAHQVLTAVSSGGVTTLPSGAMVDPAMTGRAETIIALADAVASAEGAGPAT
jgi:citrate lyase subunit beta / citryl-CoA lyase